MKEETHLLHKVRQVILYVLVALFPLFFMPLTQEYFLTGKLYFLFFGSLILLFISAFEFLLTKKLVWERKPFDNIVVLFFITAVLSVIFSSPNKVQALVNPGFGIMPLFSYLVLYFYLSREKGAALKQFLIFIPAAILSVIALFFVFNPMKNVTLPVSLQFLKNPYFNPLGNQLDAAIFLGFAVVIVAAQVFAKESHHRKEMSPLLLSGLIVFLAGLGATIYSLILSFKDTFVLPPVNLSWYAAVETLKQPVTALFGVGIDNFSAMFTRVKDIGYNSTGLWQISSFNVSRSALLHVVTETGIFGGAALGLMILQLLKRNIGSKKHLLVLGYVLLMMLIFPISMVMMFILFVLLSGVGVEDKPSPDSHLVLNVDKILPLYVVMLILSFSFVGVAGYFGGRAYAAEIYFKQAINGFASNNANTVYNNMRTAIIINPYIERYRINFSQTNLLIANNVAQRAASQNKEGQKTQLTDQERQTISQAIQAAIDEAKAAVTLNPQNAGNWQNLAAIYRNIINIAQGADSWTVSAYQRAIVLDPQNPVYRVDLGGVLFGLQNYDQAAAMFQQAIGLKPDWPNAYYNLAWSAYQKQDYQTAAAAMQSTVSLLDPKKDSADYKRATADLQEFMKKLPNNGEATGSANEQTNKLSIPTPGAQKVEPKIQLPKEASPGAK